MIQIQIEVTEAELQRLEDLAQQLRFESPEAYIKSLALEPTRDELLTDIRDGLLAVQRGEAMPTLKDMWEALETEDDQD